MPIDRAEAETLRATIPSAIHFGTSTWNYPGWRGLIYERDYPAAGASAKMLAEYARFPLFTTVGIDSSFYGPPTAKTLASYAAALPPGFRCVSKVWDRLTVHTFSDAREKQRAGERNPDFLNPDLFLSDVYELYQQHFAEHAGPFVFEFQAIARGPDGLGPQAFADALDTFFNRLPREGQYAVEVRNAEFLTPPYFAVLREHGVSHVFNSWTRMPPIGLQLDLPGVITSDFVVSRALLRPGRSYSEAVRAFAPYDRIQDPNPALRTDLATLAKTALSLRIPAYLIVNNRAEGSAPLTIMEVARMVAA